MHKLTTFNNAYQLSSSVKDVGEGADRDDADALSVGERNCGMNLVRGIVIIIIVVIIIIIIIIIIIVIIIIVIIIIIRCSLYR